MSADEGKAESKRKPKVRVLRWRGVLNTERRIVRTMVAIVLVSFCVALTFTSLGFTETVIPGSDQVSYAVVILQPVALSALLLGPGWGALVGLVAGTALYVHSIVMPLSYYEIAFISPVTSIVMLTVLGFVLGLLFAIALRNDPPPLRRFIYIVLVCLFASGLYSAGFSINVVISLVGEVLSEAMANNLSDAEVEARTTEALVGIVRLGEMGTQMWLDAIVMTVLCFVGDFAARKGLKSEGKIGLRSQFATWLAVVVLLAFMVTEAGSFIAVSLGEISRAGNLLRGEVDYVVTQLQESDRHTASLIKFLESRGIDLGELSNDELDRLGETVTVEKLLDGYIPAEDGIILVVSGNGEADSAIILSDDERFVVSQPLGEFLHEDTIQALVKSIENDSVERTVYDETDGSMLDLESIKSHVVKSTIAYAYAKQMDEYTVISIRPADLVFADRISVMLWTTLSVFVLLLAVFILMHHLLSRLVVRRIEDTNGVLARIGQGDLEARVDVRDTPEFASLSDGINETVGALKGWIAEAETRMDAELATAKAIQIAALPRTFPPYPDNLHFDIYATMHPAREVGGDFYDFFLIGDDSDADSGKLGFVIADVSGKGVPAALFMMKAKTQIRDYLMSGMDVGEAVENANHQLCDGNDASMFVTAWIGVLDYATGYVQFVNAGHNPPLLWQRDSWRWVSEKSGLPLGLFDGMPYAAHSIQCNIGDEFLLYTDGVTEALNVEGDLFGEDKLEQVAVRNYTLHPHDLVEAVHREVTEYAMGAVQSDDITILSLEVGVPPEIAALLTIPARVEELPRITEFIHNELDRRLCPLRAQNQIDVAIEELFVNVARYAYPDATPEAPGVARISYAYTADPPCITVEIIDAGIPFDPLAKPDAVTPDDIMDVPIGGLGILMAKKSVDEMYYRREDDTNIVTLVKRW